MDWLNILVLVTIIIIVVGTGLYFLNRWALKKSGQQRSMIERTKMDATIYVIDKKRDLAKNVNLPKAVMDNLPKIYRAVKMNFVRAKIGSQIVTLMCDKKIFNAIQIKKNAKVEIAGIYIVTLKGMKTDAELRQLALDKKAKIREAKAKDNKKSS